MKTTEAYCLVMVTAPSQEAGRRLAQLALEARLAACANLIPGLESYFWWEGRIDSSKEALVLFKTERVLLGELEALVVGNHPYDTPEFIVVGIEAGNEKYLEWIGANVRRGSGA